ncbi:hypothetical protein BpHYR1_012113 [Brachionus plicatilis]|uniref:Uncharacterized protein n=1 Tax=Brachionus plicatilis TaxID=10195 RepID=A0A3M7SVF2_BRAPC|nr:hypothetical protein BpHYR1_012113 [Brachionus plicatilis]
MLNLKQLLIYLCDLVESSIFLPQHAIKAIKKRIDNKNLGSYKFQRIILQIKFDDNSYLCYKFNFLNYVKKYHEVDAPETPVIHPPSSVAKSSASFSFNNEFLNLIKQAECVLSNIFDESETFNIFQNYFL